MKWALLAIFAILATASLQGTEAANELPPQVTLPQGKIRGSLARSRSGKNYYAFNTVPYAQAGRFELATEGPAWEGIYDATLTYDGCAQTFWITNDTVGVEDCLTLYISTPGISDEKLPVIVYFHGGGFTIGSGQWYHGGFLVDRDVILVAPNYRIGPLGFLSTGDGVFPENLGLKDQVMALKWVQQNIARFGGDPNRVTIAGGSAGGASVSYHVLSPMSTHLFQRAISLSGTCLCPWARSWNPKAMAIKYAQAIGCPASPSERLLECLKAKPLQEILGAMKELTQWGYDPFTPFGPVVETLATSGPKFLSEEPEAAFEAGRFNKVPWMVGITQDEGIMMHAGYVFGEKRLLADLNKNWKKVFSITFEFDRVYTKLTEEEQEQVSEEIYKFYFQNRPIDETTWQQLTDVYSDRLFNNGVKKALMLAGRHTDMWAYVVAEGRDDYSSLNLIGYNATRSGVGHADDLSFIFSDFHVAPTFEPASAKETLSKNIVDLLASFARFGRPTAMWKNQVEWNPVSDLELSGVKPVMYYKIASESQMVPEHFIDRYKFWESLIAKYSSNKHEEL